MRQKLELMLGIVTRPLLFAVYWLSGYTPRDPDRWVFGSWDGQRFADNAAAMFRYCAALKDSHVEPIWISRRGSIVRELRSRGYRALHAWSPLGLWTCLRAGVFVFDGYTKDINHWVSRGAMKVHLRHGIAMKRAERGIQNANHRLYQLFYGSPAQRAFWQFMVPWHTVHLDLVIASSPTDAESVSQAYAVPLDTVPVTGFPRNDMLVQNSMSVLHDTEMEAWLSQVRAGGRKIFLYMPTFRDSRQAHFPGSLVEFDKRLGKMGVSLIWHQHFADRSGQFSEVAQPLKNIKAVNKVPDAQPLLKRVDCLITDYSSVFLDFLLLRRPVVYFVPDLAEYQRSCRSLWHDYETVTPGPKAHSVAELLAAMRNIVRTGGCESSDVANYQEVLERFHTHQDGNASRRVFDTILARQANRLVVDCGFGKERYDFATRKLSVT